MSRLTHNERVMRDGDGMATLDQITVVRPCRVCYEPGDSLEGIHVNLVSPRGIVHECGDYGVTDCGCDATGPGWWWAE